MLNQLERLSIETEGRFATESELKLLKDYLPTVTLRLSAYQKISDREATIMDCLRLKMLQLEPNIFQTATGDDTALFQRDTKIILRSMIAAFLIDDLDRLRETILLWHRTITKAFKVQHIAALTYNTLPSIIEQFLTPEEYALILPFLRLNQAVLAS
ncbi:MAG: allophycocyanin [Cyanobacteria bacterium J06623_7]